MLTRLPLSARLGLAAILAGVLWYAGWLWWAASEQWRPLAQRVSVAHRRLRSREFQITVASTYEFGINTRVNCPTPSRVSWALRQGRRVVRVGQGDTVRGSFTASEGRYSLDFDLGQEGCRAGSSSPRLSVVEGGDAQDQAAARVDSAGDVFLLLLIAGAFLVLRTTIPRWRWDVAAKLWQRCPAGTQQVAVAVCALAFAVLVRAAVAPATPRRIVVELPSENTSTARVRPIYILLRCEPPDATPVLFIDGQHVEWDELEPVLRAQLQLRPSDLPVYLEADSELAWGPSVEVVDIVTSLQGKVVLVGRRGIRP